MIGLCRIASFGFIPFVSYEKELRMLKSGMSVSRMPEPKRFPAALHIALETGVSVLLELYVFVFPPSFGKARQMPFPHTVAVLCVFFQSPRVCVH